MKLEFSGAARGVTGSKHLLHINGKKILLDCGLFQGRRLQTIIANLKFPFEAREIDAVVLSHAHIDHSGALPLLIKEGYEGPIYCTHATRDLCSIMLRDSGYIQEKDADWLRRKLKNPEADPLYTVEDAEKVMSHFRSVDYEQRFQVAPGVWVTFHDAGHILGSAVEEWEIEDEEEKKSIRLGFTGDLGRRDLPILRDPVQLKDLDVLITESTYGDRLHDEIADVEAQVEATVNETIARGGTIVVPAFAVGRTQEVLYVLKSLIDKKRIKPLPIFVDSPLAKAATEVVSFHPECFDEEMKKLLGKDIDIFHSRENVQFTESVEESKALNDFPEPCIIISASGMCEAGRIRHHLINKITDPKNTVMIVGFMAQNTLGRKIVEKENPVNIFGEPYELNANVRIFNAFSGHADQKGLLKFASQCGKPKNIFCVHGEFEQTKTFREEIEALDNVKSAGTSVHIPAPGDIYGVTDHQDNHLEKLEEYNEISRSIFPEVNDAPMEEEEETEEL